MPLRIGWDISHQEFTIFDDYYFSKLRSELVKRNIIVEEVKNWGEIKKFNVIVINYPEKKFSNFEVELLTKFLENGGKVIALGYYRNEDNIAETINSLTEKFGLTLLSDEVFDARKADWEKYFVVTDKIFRYNTNARKVLMPCSASIKVSSNNVKEIVVGGENVKTSSGNKPIMAVEKKVGLGKLILVGTCVFWDNYSIEKFDNLKFSLNILIK